MKVSIGGFMFKMAIVSVFLLISSTVFAQSKIVANVGCDRKIICSDEENCKAKISYWIGNGLTVNSFNFYPEEGNELNIDQKTGAIAITNKDGVISLGSVDLKSLKCMVQESDYVKIRLDIPETTSVRLKETESSSFCESVWNGQEWLSLKRIKYGLFFNGNHSPLFNTSLEVVSCFK